MSLDHKFQEACNQVKNLTKKPSDDELLELYSLFKQATIGDVNIAKPNDLKAKAKWDAWNKKKGVKSSSAKEEYVKKANNLSKNYS